MRPHLFLAVVLSCSFSTSLARALSVDLSQYQRIARYALPEPTMNSAPAGSLLAHAASSVT